VSRIGYMNLHRGTEYQSAPCAKGTGVGVTYAALSALLVANPRPVSKRTAVGGRVPPVIGPDTRIMVRFEGT
jgi:hypothetical protein